MKELNFAGSYNTRDLGGFPAHNHQTTNYGVLIRSGNFEQLMQKGQQAVLDYGVKIVIDVRDEWEMKDYPNPFASTRLLAYRGLPLVGDDLTYSEKWREHTKGYVEVHDLYIKYLEGCKPQIKYLEGCKPQIKQIIGAFAGSDSATVIHCHAGKDRTGIISALILATVGVPDDLIADDYAQSRKHIQHLITQWRAYAIKKGRDMAQFERDNASSPHTMIAMLKHIRHNYQSVQGYLLECGLSEQQLLQVRDKLLVTAPKA